MKELNQIAFLLGHSKKQQGVRELGVLWGGGRRNLKLTG